MSETWETVSDDFVGRLSRMPVPGGWLYRYLWANGAAHLVFVPAPFERGSQFYTPEPGSPPCPSIPPCPLPSPNGYNIT